MNENAQQREKIVNSIRQYHDKLVNWVSSLKREKKDVNFEEAKKYSDAIEYFQNFRHDSSKNYSSVIAYLRELYEKQEKLDKLYDEKAESIIKNLGGGSALLSVGALFSIKTDQPLSIKLAAIVICCLIPSLVFSIYAIIRASSVRRPRPSASFPGVDFAIKCAEYYEPEKVDINIWLILHPICEAYAYRNQRKADEVEAAHWNYCVAIGLLALPAVALAISLVIFSSV